MNMNMAFALNHVLTIKNHTGESGRDLCPTKRSHVRSFSTVFVINTVRLGWTQVTATVTSGGFECVAISCDYEPPGDLKVEDTSDTNER